MSGGAPHAGERGERTNTAPGLMPEATQQDDSDDQRAIVEEAPKPDAAAESSLSLGDLDAMERDFNGVDAALQRLSDGTYWTDEVSGEPLAQSLLDSDPIARQA